LKKINKNDITEIKGYANPHPIVLMVLEAVCILLNEKTDWANIKVVMQDLYFLDKLKSYEKNNIPDNILKKVRVYTSKPEFDPQIVGQKNLASKSLSMWCKAIDNYAKVVKEVEPKKKKLAELEKVFDDKNKILFMKQKELEKVKEKVAKLQKDCE
jgi:dynein heavy chain